MVATMVGEVALLAAVAAVKPTAEGGGAAREDSPHSPVVGGGELGAVTLGVRFPVLGEDVCQVEGHGFAVLRLLCERVSFFP
jgi:hypothetical protein